MDTGERPFWGKKIARAKARGRNILVGFRKSNEVSVTRIECNGGED